MKNKNDSKKEEVELEKFMRFTLGGETEVESDFLKIDKLLDAFIEKHGGQYLCVLVFPHEGVQHAEKYKIGTSSKVVMLPRNPEAPFNHAIEALKSLKKINFK